MGRCGDHPGARRGHGAVATRDAAVISVDTRFSGFDARSWHRLVTLVAPGIASHPPHAYTRRASERGGLLIVVHRGGRVIRAVHSQRGVVPAEVWPGPEGLEALAVAHG